LTAAGSKSVKSPECLPSARSNGECRSRRQAACATWTPCYASVTPELRAAERRAEQPCSMGAAVVWVSNRSVHPNAQRRPQDTEDDCGRLPVYCVVWCVRTS
jgi:hypothetical protein